VMFWKVCIKSLNLILVNRKRRSPIEMTTDKKNVTAFFFPTLVCYKKFKEMLILN